jgi:CHC2 zinc finger/Toprim-like
MEGNRKSIWDEVKRIDLVDYLDTLGIQPQKVRNNDYWYLSPFRQEKTPSFKINRNQNVWFDHGTGEGGTIIDFGAKLFQCTYHEFIEKLTNGNFQDLPKSTSRQASDQPKSNKLEIITVSDLSNPEVIGYLKERAISPELAKQYCHEVEFKIGTRNYIAVGFANRSGGYELRNSWFKGSSSPKDISLISTGQDKVSVLEGFIDFLSALQIENRTIRQLTHNSDFLVLNSLRLVSRALPIIQPYSRVNLFLDNDLSANQVKDTLKANGILYRDASPHYDNSKDLNEYLISTKKLGQTKDEEQTLRPHRKSRGMRM